MSPDDWRIVEDLFHEALERDPASRNLFLDQASADAAVITEVRRLLAEHDAEPQFMEQPIIDAGLASDALDAVADNPPALPDSSSPAGFTAGLDIPGYRIIELIGEGGMGLVYAAGQESPQRQVALKIIRPGFITADALRRFDHESQILGRLRHPGIGRIFQAGAADAGGVQLPFFAMEFIDGVPITRFVREHGLGLRDRLRLFAELCEAVHYAHQQGVIHRDLKPGNILVETGSIDGKPPRPIVLDFGVARVMDGSARSMVTDRTHLIGTLPYMSPEQIAADTDGIDIRSDVYALGVILYELLAGTRPHDLDDTSLTEAIRIITEVSPAPLGTIDRRLRGDLETIVGKAMAKERQQRYQAASALLADVRRYLNNEPIAARPPSVTYQARMFARRNRTLVAGAAAVILALVAGLATTLWQMNQANRNAMQANQRAEQVTAINDFLQEILTLVNDPAATHDIRFADLLDRAAADVHVAFADRPLAEASVRETLGDAYHRMGRIADSEEQYQRGLQIRLEHLGRDDPETLAMMSGISMCWMAKAKLDDAETMCRQVLDGRTRVLGQYHRKTLAVLANLAAIADMRGNKEEAEDRYRQLLPILQEHLGPDDRDTLACMQNLASILRTQDRFDEAEPLYRDSVDAFMARYGQTNPDTLKAIDNLAVFLKHAGQFEEAETYYLQGLDGSRRLLGDAHPSTLTAMHNYGTFLFSQRRFDESLALLDEAATISQDELGDRNWLAQAIRRRYASYLRSRSMFDRAEPHYLALYNTFKDQYGDDSKQTAQITRDLVRLYEKWNRPDDKAAFEALLPHSQPGED